MKTQLDKNGCISINGDNEPMMRIMQHSSGLRKQEELELFKDCPEAIPFAMLNEEQAKRNHSQTLKRLNERGGLGVAEALDIIKKQRWSTTKESRQAVEELIKLYNDFQKSKTELPITPHLTDEFSMNEFPVEQKPYYADMLDLVNHNNNMLRVMFDPDWMLHFSIHESPDKNGVSIYISKEQARKLQSLLNRHLTPNN